MSSSHMEQQATINIGTIGHVAHGKTTLVKCITGISTIRYKSELERNITMKLGYANAKVYKCRCERPACYSTHPEMCTKCGATKQLVKHVSFVDCPGHDHLMATMLNGTAIMDAALLLVAANESCPQPQTTEHLFAIEIMNLKRIIVVQNKIDLVTREKALEQHEQIKTFLKTSNAAGPIIPASSQKGVNVDAVLDFIVNYIEEPKRNEDEPAKMIVIRSFDVNKPGTKVKDLKGGVFGGSIITGIMKIGDEIEIRPGAVEKRDGKYECRPYHTKITSLKTESTSLSEAVPGGLIGVGTALDPNICKGDKLVGMVVGLCGTLPAVYFRLGIHYELFHKTVNHKCESIKKDENLRLNIGSTTIVCQIEELNGNEAKCMLASPCCCEIGERFAISRKYRNSWRLIGYGTVKSGEEAEIRE